MTSNAIWSSLSQNGNEGGASSCGFWGEWLAALDRRDDRKMRMREESHGEERGSGSWPSNNRPFNCYYEWSDSIQKELSLVLLLMIRSSRVGCRACILDSPDCYQFNTAATHSFTSLCLDSAVHCRHTNMTLGSIVITQIPSQGFRDYITVLLFCIVLLKLFCLSSMKAVGITVVTYSLLISRER